MTSPDEAKRPGSQAMQKLLGDAYEAMVRLSGLPAAHGLEPDLLELVKLRASQINGCAFCISHHVNDARKHGVPDEKLFMLETWHETPRFSAREKAAMAWTERLTRIADGVTEADYGAVRKEFSETEAAYLTVAIMAINGWNRLAISYGYEPAPIRPPR